MANRWQTFRTLDDSIPTRSFEAAVFLHNAVFHLLSHGGDCGDAIRVLNHAHERVNDTIFAVKEVA